MLLLLYTITSAAVYANERRGWHFVYGIMRSNTTASGVCDKVFLCPLSFRVFHDRRPNALWDWCQAGFTTRRRTRHAGSPDLQVSINCRRNYRRNTFVLLFQSVNKEKPMQNCTAQTVLTAIFRLTCVSWLRRTRAPRTFYVFLHTWHNTTKSFLDVVVHLCLVPSVYNALPNQHHLYVHHVKTISIYPFSHQAN